jgi:Fur family ferric uptake transcriptional regulator
MARSTDTAQIEEALAAVRLAGGRVTPTKRALLGILASNPSHLNADQLTELVQRSSPDVAPSTIYRILEELERIGVVEHSHAGKGPTSYHLAHDAHGHLVCERCGTTIEAPTTLFDELVSQASVSYGFTVDPHHFAVLGICEACAASS